jgi:hypothetical protein
VVRVASWRGLETTLEKLTVQPSVKATCQFLALGGQPGSLSCRCALARDAVRFHHVEPDKHRPAQPSHTPPVIRPPINGNGFDLPNVRSTLGYWTISGKFHGTAQVDGRLASPRALLSFIVSHWGAGSLPATTTFT